MRRDPAPVRLAGRSADGPRRLLDPSLHGGTTTSTAPAVAVRARRGPTSSPSSDRSQPSAPHAGRVRRPDRAQRRLAVILEAARRLVGPRTTSCCGPPGLGKTSLAGIVATEMDVTMQVTSGPALERPGDLAAIPHQAGRRRRPVHRRDPPALPVDRRGPLPGHGRTSSSTSSRARAPRRLDPPGPARFCLVPGPPPAPG